MAKGRGAKERDENDKLVRMMYAHIEKIGRFNNLREASFIDLPVFSSADKIELVRRHGYAKHIGASVGVKVLACRDVPYIPYVNGPSRS